MYSIIWTFLKMVHNHTCNPLYFHVYLCSCICIYIIFLELFKDFQKVMKLTHVIFGERPTGKGIIND